jgi:hypothetical protein
VQLSRQSVTAPVIVSTVTLNGVAITPGKPFVADDDWLKNMTIVITNRSPKTIVDGWLLLALPETGDGTRTNPEIAQQIQFGQLPESARHTASGKTLDPSFYEPMSLSPHQQLTIPLAPFVATLRRNVETKGSFSAVSTILVQLSVFYFNDDTKWDNGTYEKPDPDHVGRYLRIPYWEFTGDQNH